MSDSQCCEPDIQAFDPGADRRLGCSACRSKSLLANTSVHVGAVCKHCSVVHRYLLRGMVVDWLASRFPKWPSIDAALSKEGWKLITLLRLSPIVPWNVLNYALAVTGVTATLVLSAAFAGYQSWAPIAMPSCCVLQAKHKSAAVCCSGIPSCPNHESFYQNALLALSATS